jgi:hypothetical protein
MQLENCRFIVKEWCKNIGSSSQHQSIAHLHAFEIMILMP